MLSLILSAALLVTNQAAQPAAPDNVARARAVLSALMAGNFSTIESQFTDQMKAALPPGRIAGTWAALLARSDPHKGCASEPRVATFRSSPALNHLFIAGTGKSDPAEYAIPSHVAEDVIRDIAAFIKR